MQKLLAPIFALLAFLFLSMAHAQQLPVAPTVAAKSWLLLEAGSGQVLASQAPDEHVEPASLTKLMTAYLTFAAIRQKTIAINQTVPVSERAWRTGGSKMFIRVGTQVGVDDLIKGMIVQSGNDACIALAEAIAGSEEQFAAQMQREAQRLGMKNTSFRNATGLPDPQHYTTARDLSLLAAALVRDFPDEYGKYYSMKEFRYNNITQPNRNRLLWLDPTVDGMKTGHTEAAGYCLISSAKRGPRRLISVVLGANSDATRASESLKLLNWGYQFFDAIQVYAKGQVASNPRVWKGTENTAKAGFEQDLIVAVPKGYANKIEAQFVSQQPIMAPVTRGQPLGTVKITIDGKPYGEFTAVALEAVPVAGFFGRLIDTIKLWFQ
ncbi:MAG: D-alanyl-D-alanine carboxypeptidase family protein [Betaproteobacteria bacterium]